MKMLLDFLSVVVVVVWFSLSFDNKEICSLCKRNQIYKFAVFPSIIIIIIVYNAAQKDLDLPEMHVHKRL